MIIRKYIIEAVFVFFIVIFVLPIISNAQAATIKFEPSSINTNVGETFEVDIIVDTKDKEILSVDAVGQFSGLEVESITDGTFLEVGRKEFGEAGSFYVAGVVSSAGESAIGEGTLATIQFKATESGTHTITFVCEIGETNESNISEKVTDATDIIECSANGEAIVTVSGDSTGNKNPQPTPSQLPRSGIFESFVIYAVLGGVLFTLGIGAKLLL